MSGTVKTNAEQTVKNVRDVQHKRESEGGGGDNAYNKLQEEIQTEKLKLAATPESKIQYQDYISKVQTGLQKSGLLPELTLEWAHANQSSLITASKSSDSITKEGLLKYPEFAKQITFGQELDAANQMFSAQLSSDFDSLAKSGKIKDKNLTEALTTQKELHGEIEQTMRLMPPAVFNILDTAGSGADADGAIGRKNITAFVKNQNNDITLKGLGFTPQETTDLRTGLTNIEHNWNSAAVEKLRGGKDHNLTQASINNAYGFATENDGAIKVDQTAIAPDRTNVLPDRISAKLIEESKALPGNGYIKIAARLLGKPDANDTDPAVNSLYKELQELNGHKTLHPGDPALTADLLKKVKSEALRKHIDDQVQAEQAQQFSKR